VVEEDSWITVKYVVIINRSKSQTVPIQFDIKWILVFIFLGYGLLSLIIVVMKKMKASFSEDTSYNHTARITTPIGFKGANKIMGIFGITPDTRINEYYKEIYDPEFDDLRNQIQQRIGQFKVNEK